MFVWAFVRANLVYEDISHKMNPYRIWDSMTKEYRTLDTVQLNFGQEINPIPFKNSFNIELVLLLNADNILMPNRGSLGYGFECSEQYNCQQKYATKSCKKYGLWVRFRSVCLPCTTNWNITGTPQSQETQLPKVNINLMNKPLNHDGWKYHFGMLGLNPNSELLNFVKQTYPNKTVYFKLSYTYKKEADLYNQDDVSKWDKNYLEIFSDDFKIPEIYEKLPYFDMTNKISWVIDNAKMNIKEGMVNWTPLNGKLCITNDMLHNKYIYLSSNEHIQKLQSYLYLKTCGKRAKNSNKTHPHCDISEADFSELFNIEINMISDKDKNFTSQILTLRPKDLIYNKVKDTDNEIEYGFEYATSHKMYKLGCPPDTVMMFGKPF